MVVNIPIADYIDENNNRIITNGSEVPHGKVTFRGGGKPAGARRKCLFHKPECGF